MKHPFIPTVAGFVSWFFGSAAANYLWDGHPNWQAALLGASVFGFVVFFFARRMQIKDR